jgi:hypothetical protein
MQYRVLPRQVGAKPENGICISLQIEGFAEHGCIAGTFAAGLLILMRDTMAVS